MQRGISVGERAVAVERCESATESGDLRFSKTECKGSENIGEAARLAEQINARCRFRWKEQPVLAPQER